jgi:hypothetical protein
MLRGHLAVTSSDRRFSRRAKGGHEPARAGLGPSLLLARSKWARLGLARLFHELEKWARLELDGNSGWLGLARELDAYSHCHMDPTIRGCLIDLSGASRTYALLFQVLLPLRVQRQWLRRDSPGSAVAGGPRGVRHRLLRRPHVRKWRRRCVSAGSTAAASCRHRLKRLRNGRFL